MFGVAVVHGLIRLALFPGFFLKGDPLIGFGRRLIVCCCFLDLASKDIVADERVDQHQWKDESASPEHEH